MPEPCICTRKILAGSAARQASNRNFFGGLGSSAGFLARLLAADGETKNEQRHEGYQTPVGRLSGLEGS